MPQRVLGIFGPREESGPVTLVFSTVCLEEPSHLLIRSFYLPIGLLMVHRSKTR